MRNPTGRSAAGAVAAAMVLGVLAVPAHAAVPPAQGGAAQLSAQLQQLVSPTLTVAQNPLLRNLVREGAEQQFDGDTNVLLTDVVQRSEQEQIVDPNDDAWVQFKNGVNNFAPVGGHSYKPQIYIPNIEDTAVPAENVVVAVQPADGVTDSLTGYRLDDSGNAGTTGFPVDEAYVSTHEVWLLSVNEESEPPTGDDEGGPVTIAGTKPAAPKAAKGASRGSTQSVNCNPSSKRLNRGVEYLTGYKVPSPNDLEHWWQGKLEMGLKVYTANDWLISITRFGKVKHRTARNGVAVDSRLLTWDRDLYGDTLIFYWYERDPNSDDAGQKQVLFSDPTTTPYDTGQVQYTVCSVGGDGNDGNENYARSAAVGVSSTFGSEGYAREHVNDGDRNTALGGPFSWTNSASRWPGNGTEWVDLDFGFNRTFQRVVVYTTASHPIKDFDIQVLSSTVGWRTIASRRGNTQSVVTVTFPVQIQRQVRILALSGPDLQPGFVRINEFEVYANP